MRAEARTTVREATPADGAELARLRWDFRVGEHPEQSRAGFFQDFGAWLADAMASGRWVVAVAEAAPDALCGCMYLELVSKLPVPGKSRRMWGYITSCYVASEQRGQGIGRKLLDLLINAARARGLEFLILWPSEEAVSFYRRAGFRPVSEVYAGTDDEPPLALAL